MRSPFGSTIAHSRLPQGCSHLHLFRASRPWGDPIERVEVIHSPVALQVILKGGETSVRKEGHSKVALCQNGVTSEGLGPPSGFEKT